MNIHIYLSILGKLRRQCFLCFSRYNWFERQYFFHYNTEMVVDCNMYRKDKSNSLQLQEKVLACFASIVHIVMILRFIALTRVVCRYGLNLSNLPNIKIRTKLFIFSLSTCYIIICSIPRIFCYLHNLSQRTSS